MILALSLTIVVATGPLDLGRDRSWNDELVIDLTMKKVRFLPVASVSFALTHAALL